MPKATQQVATDLAKNSRRVTRDRCTLAHIAPSRLTSCMSFAHHWSEQRSTSSSIAKYACSAGQPSVYVLVVL
jgi:hypothetical protein